MHQCYYYAIPDGLSQEIRKTMQVPHQQCRSSTVSFGSSCEGLIEFGYFVLFDVLILIIENPTIMLLISKHYGNKRLYLKKNILKKLKRVCILKGFTFHPLLRI